MNVFSQTKETIIIMSTQNISSPRKHRWRSLPFLISIALVFATIVPLVVTFAFIYLQTTPALINQANKTMIRDAQTNVQLINNYLQERLLDVETVQQAASQVANVQKMLTVDQPGSPAFQQDATVGGYYIVEIGMIRSKDYTDWTIFSKTGQLLLAYPTPKLVQPHGNSLIPAEDLAMVNAGKTFISPVFYSTQTKESSVDIYAPIMAATQTAQTQPSAAAKHSPPIGVLRATLNLKYIASVVQNDTGSNGNGSYAYIVDDNGIRIIDPNSDQRFTSLTPLNSGQQQLLSSEERFGSMAPIAVTSDPAIAQAVQSNKQSSSLQEQPAGEKQQFQVVQQEMNAALVPWNYIVLSPVSSETAVAQQQQLNIIIVAILTTLVVAIIGLLVGRGISRPIMRAVQDLQNNSKYLNALSTRQQDAASSQMWVVESSQVGLKSVNYYTHATDVAANQLAQMTSALMQSWQYLNTQERRKRLEQIEQLMTYMKNASNYLGTSNQKLENALTLATEVAEQLHEGSRSSNESAAQLEKIVEALRTVIGR